MITLHDEIMKFILKFLSLLLTVFILIYHGFMWLKKYKLARYRQISLHGKYLSSEIYLLNGGRDGRHFHQKFMIYISVQLGT